MNYGLPQGAMHNMRARFADGAPMRNRSMEQRFSGSGNPNMPMFNTKPAQGFHKPQLGTGGQPVRTATMPAIGGYLSNLAASGAGQTAYLGPAVRQQLARSGQPMAMPMFRR